jgi:lysophospholipase L1-like esterase
MDIIFVRYPVSEEYYELATTEYVDEEKFYHFLFTNINNTIGSDYTVLDYHDIFWEHPEYFSNADHLNNKGAVAFSIIIEKNLSELYKSS